LTAGVSKAAFDAIDDVMRESRARLLALLASRSRDIAACEDALSKAFESALKAWPRDGVPDNPPAWIFRAARNAFIDSVRSAGVARERALELVPELEEPHRLGDRRLELLFVCCHPAIDATARTPLMLQTILGLGVDEIASSFLVSPSAMEKRLTRAKQKIRSTGIPFEVPDDENLSERLAPVLEAIFAVYGHAWDLTGVDPERSSELEGEAQYLAELLVELLPREPEPKGLAALVAFSRSRSPARRSSSGEFCPFEEQDVSTWNGALIQRAEQFLASAFDLKRPGVFQLEAAIQSAHVARRLRGVDTWPDILVLYEGLLKLGESLGARLGWISALAQVEGPERALVELGKLEAAPLQAHQPYWAVRAHLFAQAGKPNEPSRLRRIWRSRSISRVPCSRCSFARKSAIQATFSAALHRCEEQARTGNHAAFMKQIISALEYLEQDFAVYRRNMPARRDGADLRGRGVRART
jgi:RNA polymerase sigma-70 factor (ECF subfamily)